MLMFQGMIFKDKEDLDKYIMSQTKIIDKKSNKVVTDLQKYFQYEIIDIDRPKTLNGLEYNILTFKINDYTKIEQVFFDTDEMETMQKELTSKIHIINKITPTVINMGIESMYCKHVVSRLDSAYQLDKNKQPLYKTLTEFKFVFKIHNNDNEKEVIFNPNMQSIDGFIKNFRQYTVNTLEGTWNCSWCNLTIDGIEIEGLLDRAKKIRLEIIE